MARSIREPGDQFPASSSKALVDVIIVSDQIRGWDVVSALRRKEEDHSEDDEEHFMESPFTNEDMKCQMQR